jgi:uncharacterized protein YcgL (UPF0745 family)
MNHAFLNFSAWCVWYKTKYKGQLYLYLTRLEEAFIFSLVCLKQLSKTFVYIIYFWVFTLQRNSVHNYVKYENNKQELFYSQLSQQLLKFASKTTDHLGWTIKVSRCFSSSLLLLFISLFVMLSKTNSLPLSVLPKILHTS